MPPTAPRCRDWIWRGWQIRYAYAHPGPAASHQTPLLLIHGFGSSWQQWHRNLSIIGEHYPVYALDLLGFGRSQKAATAYRVPLWADLVFDFWQTFIGRPMVLVGHSLGALVAATAAVDHPQAVSTVVLLTLPETRQEVVGNPQARRAIQAVEGLVASPALIRLIFQVVRRPRFIRAGLKLAYANPESVTDELVAQVIAPTADRGAAQTLCRLTQAATSTTYSASRTLLLSQLSQPTLLIWGTGDRIIPFKQVDELCQLNPQVTLLAVPGAGHCLYDEAAEMLNRAILDWVSEGRHRLRGGDPAGRG
ncbi:MAG: alpha/beta fold hydrolase [Elainellaceae cyanobacterium]